MAEKRTTYKIQDIEGIGEVQIADEVVTIIFSAKHFLVPAFVKDGREPWQVILPMSW